MTTTTTFQGLEPGSKSSSRVLRPPGGGSNISFGADEDKGPTRKNKMASSIFAEPEDPHAHRRNNPPGGKPTGVLCGESSAPLRRCQNQQPEADNNNHEPTLENSTGQDKAITEDGDYNTKNAESTDEPEFQEPREDGGASSNSSHGSIPAAGVPSGRRNPPGGKSSLILG